MGDKGRESIGPIGDLVTQQAMTKAGKHANRNSDGEADPLTLQDAELQEGLDYYVEDGLLVFTGVFLRKRGYCCQSGCRHCPYDKELNDLTAWKAARK
jgi:hypothetical protein